MHADCALLVFSFPSHWLPSINTHINWPYEHCYDINIYIKCVCSVLYVCSYTTRNTAWNEFEEISY